MAVPYVFGTATTAIPLSQLDSNFNTTITLGNTAIQLGNVVTTLNNITLSNATVSSVSTPITIVQGGTGANTATTAFNALAPSQTTNSGKYLTTDGTNSSWATVVSGASISNDTSTSTNVYPLFANVTTGVPTTVFTGNTKLLYKPSTGELQSTAMVSSNGITVNANTVAADYTIAAANNGMSAGPITVNSGITVTVSSGSTWVVV